MKASSRPVRGGKKNKKISAAERGSGNRSGALEKDPRSRKALRSAGTGSGGRTVRKRTSDSGDRRVSRLRGTENYSGRMPRSGKKTTGKRKKATSSQEALLSQGREQNVFSMFLASLVVVIILIVVGVNAVSLGRRLVENKNELAVLRKELKLEEEREKDIEEYRRYTQTDAYIEEVAREKLGLIYEGETVFKEEK